MINFWIVAAACFASFGFGVLIMALFCAPYRADWAETVDENIILKRRLDRISETATAHMAHNHAKCVKIARGRV